MTAAGLGVRFAFCLSHNRPPSPRQTLQAQHKRNRNLRDRIEEISKQRDEVASLRNDANAKILELTDHVAELEAKLPASNVTPMSHSP
jgi:chromosome segregation ATPase